MHFLAHVAMTNIILIISFVFFCNKRLYCAAAGVYGKGPCPDVKPVENYNLSAYCQGTWYEIARYSNDFENEGDCVVTTSKYSNGSCLLDSVERVGGKEFTLEGRISMAPDAGSSGLIYMHAANTTIMDAIHSLIVPAVDYDNFSLIYRCAYNETSKIHHDYLWVQARKKKLEGAAKVKFDEAIKGLSYLDSTKFVWNHFNEKYCGKANI